MPILVVRHGEAMAAHGNDEERVLSLRGRDEARAIASALSLRGMVPAMMIASPLVRAVQTAELLAQGLGYAGLISVDRAFEPHGDALRAEHLLTSVPGLVVAVSHEPFVRVITARLTGQASVKSFRTAECALIDGGRVVLRLDPDTA
ncbi:SixA phosphatase family protein [Sandaracinus amylolyticus]|uniref:Phosphohistidine phosphatase, SixA n=1 Tax=Sandaracinus amylolyticus TaxID=927083 RepID=A0A0F6SI76_9BACT|nr:phosphoglycerate mutase family protein [Sandaracinus amylolyticus]AKF11709.1 phosphohistidine phosphatase, SixA [Sandaracinus amylolyticus]